ncbi:GIY-YIG nuclease family protein [Endozoicomonas sp. 8E]|uniref:GIY-YIG nuclease family protein n=1 Tax=Endozoicomonas sp. 8E TaxID=3035692 RepID=UPI002938EE8F|nr:GIY-YIG nuclease family protein [Endozoicomonas sp. 8E]WOG25917.1 GIY-YIG nuclease family protein [Endozoicomonas sp. 8E]
MARKELLVCGKLYRSVESACDAFNIPSYVYRSRVAKGMSTEEALSAPYSGRSKPLCVDGMEFSTITEACEYFDVSRTVYCERIKNGLSVEQALMPVDKRFVRNSKDSVVIEGSSYSSVKEACSVYGISTTSVRKRMKGGMTLEQALVTPKNESNGIVFRGEHFESQKSFIDSVLDSSPFSRATLNVRIANLRSGGALDDIALEEIVYGKKTIVDRGGWLYRLTDSVTKLSYIGITTRTVRERWASHISEANQAEAASPLKRAIRENGAESFKVEELFFAFCNKDLKQIEKTFIEEEGTAYPNGLNSIVGGSLGALDSSLISYKGQDFKSVADLARNNGRSPITVRQRIRAGMSIEEAVDRPADHSIVFRGVIYRDQSDLAASFGLSATTLRGRLSNGLSLDEALEEWRTGTCKICGVEFTRKRRVHIYCSDKCKWKAKNDGYKSGIKSKISIVYDGVVYESVSQFAKEYGIERTSFKNFLSRGLSIEEALNKCRLKDHLKSFSAEIICSRKGGKITKSDMFKSFESWASENSITVSYQKQAFTKGMVSLGWRHGRILSEHYWLDVEFV